MEQKYYEKEIKNALEHQAETCFAPEYAKEQIEYRISMGINKEEKKMKKFNFKKVAAAALLAVALTGTVCYAAGNAIGITIGITDSSQGYTRFKDLGKAEKKAGLISNAVEEFPNGYKFLRADISKFSDVDDSGNSVYSWKELDISYQNEKGNIITLDISSEKLYESDKILSQDYKKDGMTYYYNSIRNKTVPEGYVPSEKETEEMEKGILNIAEGGDNTVTENNYLYIFWEKDDRTYYLSGFDVEMDDLKQMAEYLNQ